VFRFVRTQTAVRNGVGSNPTLIMHLFCRSCRLSGVFGGWWCGVGGGASAPTGGPLASEQRRRRQSKKKRTVRIRILLHFAWASKCSLFWLASRFFAARAAKDGQRLTMRKMQMQFDSAHVAKQNMLLICLYTRVIGQ
jgi:hypothetical protein